MRKELANRRPAYRQRIRDAGGTQYDITTSFDDGKVADAWVDGGGKVGTEKHDMLTEIGRLISISLQNGVPFEELKSCVTYHSDGRPSTIIGEVFDAIDFNKKS